jgi:hypothetical protein
MVVMIRSWAIVTVMLWAVAVTSAACYKNTGSSDDGSTDVDSQEALESSEPSEENPSEDLWENCSQIAPTVLSVDFDTSRCNGAGQVLTILIDEAVPYCGEVLSWWQEMEWQGALELEIMPRAFTCSETWQSCEPGETHRAEIDIPVVERGIFTVHVAGRTYTVECAWDDCSPEYTSLEEVHVADGREYRLFNVSESIEVTAVFSTEFCGCSEFLPFELDHPAYDDDRYYKAAPEAIVCYNRCCLDCGCFDTGEISLTLESRGMPFTHEVIFQKSDLRDMRGFIASPVADPLSGCSVQPAQIVAVDGPSRYYYGQGEPLDLQVTIAYSSYPSESCCEVFTDVAYDMIQSREIRVFAFSGLCADCDLAPCPVEQTQTLSIPPMAISFGTYTVYDYFTGDELFYFMVTI